MDSDTKMVPPQGNPPPYTAAQQYPPPPVQQHVIAAYPTTTVTYGIPVVVGHQMGPQPATITCKSCNHQIVTRVEIKPTTRTHLMAAILCILGCWPCVCIPYCMDSCNNADHFCPNCNSYIGTYVN